MPKQKYATYGSAAYAPAPEEAPVRKRQPQQSPKKKPIQRPVTRKKVQTREAGAISLDAIFGFVTAGCLAALLMNSHAQLTTSADDVVKLRQELQALEAEQQILSAQYEKQFDIQRIEDILGKDMVRPTSEQVVYIDLSQPDNVNLYHKNEENNASFFEAFWELFAR